MIRDISYIINSVKLDRNISSNNYDIRLRKWTMDGLKDLSKYGLLPNFSTKKLEVVNRVAQLPDDYEEYIKIGTCINGKLVTYNINDQICLDTEYTCCNEVPVVTEDLSYVDDSLFFPYWDGERYLVPFYGYGQEIYNGGYRIDEKMGRIVFDFDPTDVIMEYRGGIDNAYIPDDRVQALEYYVHHKFCAFSNGNEKADTMFYKKGYSNQVKRIVASKGLRTQEIIDIVSNTFRRG